MIWNYYVRSEYPAPRSTIYGAVIKHQNDERKRERESKSCASDQMTSPQAITHIPGARLAVNSRASSQYQANTIPLSLRCYRAQSNYERREIPTAKRFIDYDSKAANHSVTQQRHQSPMSHPNISGACDVTSDLCRFQRCHIRSLPVSVVPYLTTSSASYITLITSGAGDVTSNHFWCQ